MSPYISGTYYSLHRQQIETLFMKNVESRSEKITRSMFISQAGVAAIFHFKNKLDAETMIRWWGEKGETAFFEFLDAAQMEQLKEERKRSLTRG